MNLEFITAAQNLPFGVSMVLLIGLVAIEGLGALMGFGLSHMLDSILPDFDFDLDIDGELDLDMAGADSSVLNHLLAWLHIGKVPAGILLLLFLASFTIAGYMTQVLAITLLGSMLPTLLASLIATVASLPSLHLSAGIVGRFIPKDETDAVSDTTFVGREAEIVLGTARRGEASQAKLKDARGFTHYILVEPAEDSKELGAGEKLQIVSKKGSIFLAKLSKESDESEVLVTQNERDKIQLET